ncbi:MAG: hypothetical protein LQ340_003453 [Diploschistes diacapsis]|nr:MAG: hypothetical protein LQ340_003453 [Diploschistes diacapsis]
MLDDPTAPPLYRTSGEPPYPTPHHNGIPDTIESRQVTLRDRITTATLLPFSAAFQVPFGLLSYLSDQLNREIEKGDTYPMIAPMPVETFGGYWFQNFGAIMVTGEIQNGDELMQMEKQGIDWAKQCLGSFYVKPNYPGRSSHVCNGGFLVTDAARNKGVGRLMGECYLEWAPKLGYTYSVFNLVYETNVASCRIWDALGFKRIGRVKGCGNLRSYPDEMIDAIIYGRDLGPEGEDYVAEERFDKIRYYLKHGKYPPSADRAEKSRLRSAATHYKLLPSAVEGDEEKLMLKDKEVISDPQKQYDIARSLHLASHGGINKTTATVAEKYHWVRIKDTVSLVIKNCPECKETNKIANTRVETIQPANARKSHFANAHALVQNDPNQEIERIVSFEQTNNGMPVVTGKRTRRPSLQDNESDLRAHSSSQIQSHFSYQTPHSLLQSNRPIPGMQGSLTTYDDLPLDPQIMDYTSQTLLNPTPMNSGMSTIASPMQMHSTNTAHANAGSEQPQMMLGHNRVEQRMSINAIDEHTGRHDDSESVDLIHQLLEVSNIP